LSRRQLRLFLGAFGDPGHAFPMLALGASLSARGHTVMLETWQRWRPYAEAHGMTFTAAPEYPVFPTGEGALSPYEAVVLATPETRRAIRELRPAAVVHDVLTLAPALASELEGVPWATLVPHVHPSNAPGFPPYALGARPPRTAAGRAIWRRLAHASEAGLRLGRRELGDARAKLGLPPLSRLRGGISEGLCIVGTFPQLEYPRPWPPEVRIVGPLLWEPPGGELELPAGDGPLVLIAPSTAQDPEQRLLACALAGLAGEPVRVLAATNRRPIPERVGVPRNALVLDWISYGRAMPASDLVITHAGHGTLARALASGCPVLAIPHVGDMGENAARADWAGVGVRMPWRFLTPTTLRLAVRWALGQRSLSARAAELAAWASANDGADRAADLVEAFAAGSS
jgi:UDP:flavonoid glycosyltransferase YjiC (YdhE family)